MERGAIRIDAKDTLGYMLLTLATRNEGQSVVELQLSLEESGIKPADTQKRTRMLKATWTMNEITQDGHLADCCKFQFGRWVEPNSSLISG